MATTQSKLKQVRYYTNLDPYYVDVDNRPLKDISDNIGILADQLDITKGAFNRGSLAAASIGIQFSMDQAFVGNLYFPGGLNLNILFGYLVQTTPFDIDNPYFRVPTMAVHEEPTNLINLAAPGTAGKSIKYLVQAYMEEATAASIVPGVDSLTKVARFAIKSSGEYTSTNAEPIIYPDTGNTACFSFVIKFGQTSLTKNDITAIHWIDQSNISDLVTGQSKTKLENARFRKYRASQTVPKGSKIFSTVGFPNIDLSYGKDSLEVYVTGVHQTNFSIDTALHQVILGGELDYDSEVTVVQTRVFTYGNITI